MHQRKRWRQQPKSEIVHRNESIIGAAKRRISIIESAASAVNMAGGLTANGNKAAAWLAQWQPHGGISAYVRMWQRQRHISSW